LDPRYGSKNKAIADRIRPLCDTQQNLNNLCVDERCFDWKSKVSMSALLELCDVQQKALTSKPHPKPYKLRASYPGSNNFYDVQQKSLLEAWRKTTRNFTLAPRIGR